MSERLSTYINTGGFSPIGNNPGWGGAGLSRSKRPSAESRAHSKAIADDILRIVAEREKLEKELKS